MYKLELVLFKNVTVKYIINNFGNLVLLLKIMLKIKNLNRFLASSNISKEF
jgi:hypothetical protein